jgi:hypothetical protein
LSKSGTSQNLLLAWWWLTMLLPKNSNISTLLKAYHTCHELLLSLKVPFKAQTVSFEAHLKQTANCSIPTGALFPLATALLAVLGLRQISEAGLGSMNIMRRLSTQWKKGCIQVMGVIMT